ncbi:MAG: redoxin domain-containing protein [Bacteroidetes bacterium]|jgi:peroxiredoxin|nr:redoxin domain-containing protein [Bacteroidota bacterium]MCL6101709.1 redoxin domain-containing protein [Bacteroidota bacterium]
MRKLFKYLVGFVLLLTAGWLIAHTFQTYRAKKEAAEKIQTLQHCCFESLHGGQTCLDGFNPHQPTVIIYFHPECEHCQYEATEIGRQPDRFAKANMILITPDDSTKRIAAFVDKFKLWQVDNLVILYDRNFQFKKYFGTSVFPSVFIYGTDKRLLKQFIGEVEMETVLKIIDGNENL